MEVSYYNLAGGINQALTKTELGLNTKKIYFSKQIYYNNKKEKERLESVYTSLLNDEANLEDDVKKFHKILDDMKEVSKINNSLKYKLGYSNFTFELWIILHKKDLKGPLTDKKQYLKYINEIFDEDFKSLDEYKEEKNFKRVVEQITLEDIINAIKRAEKIRDHNKEYNKQIKYGKYIYYKENPDLEINESIEKILNDCEIL